jgi:fatty acyl-CoA reductase
MKEPLPGWVDSLNGPMGLLVGAGKGVIRSMLAKGENKAQLVPVDIAINATIVIAQRIGSKKEKSVA